MIHAHEFIEALSHPGMLCCEEAPRRGKIYRALKKNHRSNQACVILCCPLFMTVSQSKRRAEIILGNVSAFLEDAQAKDAGIQVITGNLIDDGGRIICNDLGNKFAICVDFLTKSSFPPMTSGDPTNRPGGVQPVQYMPLPPRGHTLAECQPGNPRRDILTTAAPEEITSPRRSQPTSNRQAYSPRSTRLPRPAVPVAAKPDASTYRPN